MTIVRDNYIKDWIIYSLLLFKPLWEPVRNVLHLSGKENPYTMKCLRLHAFRNERNIVIFKREKRQWIISHKNRELDFLEQTRELSRQQLKAKHWLQKELWKRRSVLKSWAISRTRRLTSTGTETIIPPIVDYRSRHWQISIQWNPEESNRNFSNAIKYLDFLLLELRLHHARNGIWNHSGNCWSYQHDYVKPTC